MKDPTANLVRAFEVKEGDWIKPPGESEFYIVDAIEELGGDEMGCAVFRFTDMLYSPYSSFDYPYAALVEVGPWENTKGD
jgi:hypothetical protein